VGALHFLEQGLFAMKSFYLREKLPLLILADAFGLDFGLRLCVPLLGLLDVQRLLGLMGLLGLLILLL
jgi:hypothetical protein